MDARHLKSTFCERIITLLVRTLELDLYTDDVSSNFTSKSTNDPQSVKCRAEWGLNLSDLTDSFIQYYRESRKFSRLRPTAYTTSLANSMTRTKITPRNLVIFLHSPSLIDSFYNFTFHPGTSSLESNVSYLRGNIYECTLPSRRSFGIM